MAQSKDPDNKTDPSSSDGAGTGRKKSRLRYWFDQLPYSKWWPFAAGVLIGITLRLFFFGKPGNPFAPMMGAFMYFGPMLVGAVTVYVAERKERRSWSYYFWAPFAANVLCIIGTLLIMVEGLICAIVIVPLFAGLGAIGGLIMGAICRRTNWPKRAVYSFAAIPLLLGSLEAAVPLPTRISTAERSIIVNANAEQVWQQIVDVRDIRPEEVRHGWMYRIGVPLPIAGVTEETAGGRVRKITMGKGIHFDQVVADWQPNRHVRWTYRFYEDSFPPRAMDDHVRIGGHYFDMIDTSYTLTPNGDVTELKIRMQYRVSTQFNWYADAVAQLLIGNFEEVILDFYRRRSEADSVTNRRTADS